MGGGAKSQLPCRLERLEELVGLEEGARMRLERDDGGRTARVQCHLEKMLMPAMHAVEIADGHGAAPIKVSRNLVPR